VTQSNGLSVRRQFRLCSARYVLCRETDPMTSASRASTMSSQSPMMVPCDAMGRREFFYPNGSRCLSCHRAASITVASC
jgi:hypothetical protein